MTLRVASTHSRRPVHLDSLDEVLAEAERLAGQPHRTLGQWSLGQICAHLAVFMQLSLDGFDFKMPIALRVLARPLRKRFLNCPWPAGLRFPKRAAAALTPAEVPTEQGLQQLRAMIDRLSREPQRHPSPLLGKLTQDEWNRFHYRHAELHLGFVIPIESGDEASRRDVEMEQA